MSDRVAFLDPAYSERRAEQYAAAVEADTRGVPSSLPEGNPYKVLVEDHRWGRHHAGCPPFCPGPEARRRRDAAKAEQG